MTRTTYTLLTLLVAGLTAFAQADDMNMPMAKPAASNSASHHGMGVIKQISGGTVLIAHEAIKSLNWPAMTMPFEAKDKMLLNGLKPGAKVTFDFVQQDGKSVLTSLHVNP